MGVDLVPLPVQRAGGIAHGVGVFGGADRTLCVGLSHFPEPVGAGILGDDHVRVPVKFGPFVDDGAVLSILFQGLEGLVGLVEIDAVAGLVAQRQDGDAGVVGRAAVHVQRAVHVLGQPFGLVAQGAFRGIAHGVALDIGLVIHVEAQGVAQFVEFPRLGIVAGADGVDVGLSHEQKVLEDVFLRHIMPGIRIVLVQVHALELHRLSVEQKNTVFNFQSSESHMEAGIFPVHLQQQGVQLRFFCAPGADGHDAVRAAGTSRFKGGAGYLLTVRVQQLVGAAQRFPGPRLQGEQADSQVRRKGRDHAEVKARIFLFAGKVHVPLQARQAPEILVFQEGSGRIAVDAERQLVLSLPDLIRDAEAGQVLGVFAVANLLAVYINIGAALAAAEVQVHLASFPAGGDGEAAAVQGGREAFRQLRRDRILRAEVVGNVGIDGGAPALHFPVSRHLDSVPGAREAFGLPVVVKVLEVPGSVQVQVEGAVPESFGKRVFARSVENDFGAPGFGVHGGYLHVLPVGQYGQSQEGGNAHALNI